MKAMSRALQPGLAQQADQQVVGGFLHVEAGGDEGGVNASGVSNTPFDPREPISKPITGSTGACLQGASPTRWLNFICIPFRVSWSVRSRAERYVSTSTTTRLASFVVSVLGLMICARLRSVAMRMTSWRNCSP